jgi:ribonucleoside-diphosphate reductase alpha chain
MLIISVKRKLWRGDIVSEAKNGLFEDFFNKEEKKEEKEQPPVENLVTPSFTSNAEMVLRKRYLSRDSDGEILETPSEMLWRVASNVAAAENSWGGDTAQWAIVFYNMMARKEFLPNSPTLMNAGKELGQLSACFVLPVEDSMDSIFSAVKNTALIHKSGGGTGFSFSRIRPANDTVHSTKGVSSGPISFMTVFDHATETVKQGGVRRGANMAVLRVDHPDIEEFITVKQDMGLLNNFNLSIGATDAFMNAVERGEEFPLVNPRSGDTVKTLSAKSVFSKIVDSAWASGEPGLIFIDKINEANPTPHIGQIEATNPCGEQPLLPFEACNLGSVNLSLMVRRGSNGLPEVAWSRLEKTVRNAVRFLDDVIEVNKYPLQEITDMVLGNRKIGLGLMGFADLLFRLLIPYDSEKALVLAEEIMSFIEDKARQTSADLARERGAFPNFKGSLFDTRNLPPMRNATVTTIAPTGSISILAGCSSGIEPVFALAYTRKNLLDDGDELHEVVPEFARVAMERHFHSAELISRIAEKGNCSDIEEVPEDVRRVFVTSHDISPSYHVRMQAAFQKFTDNAVSKTVNLPSGATREDVAQVFRLARQLGCKGVTVYRDGSRDKQVLNLNSEKPEEMEEPAMVGPRPRPELTRGVTRRVRTGCGNLYVTINEDEHGPVEIFSQMGKAGGCAASQSEAISRMVSLALRSHVHPSEIASELKGISCHRLAWQNGTRILSCADAMGKALEWHLNGTNGEEVKEENTKGDPEPDISVIVSEGSGTSVSVNNLAGACPFCGGPLKYESGCVSCALECGYSECG